MKTQILFVDDEPKILDGLRRSLRACRSEWEMYFATGGEEALALMAQAPIDVLVTDMCMPVMDGAELMRCVRSRYPGTVRIVLSGQFNKAAGLRAVAVAHQFLSKPSEPSVIKSAVRHSLAVRELLTGDEIRRAAGAVGALPFRPQTHAALLQVLDQPDAAMEAIATVIERDAAVTAKILQVVNSAFLGLPHHVSSILHAVQLLGLEDLKQVALSAEIMVGFHIPPELREFPMERLHVHSQLCARIAGRLPIPEPRTAQAVVGSLLHDIGKLVVACQVPGRFARICAAVDAGKQTWLEAENEQLGANHAEIGGYLLGLWGLPEPIVEAVLSHHRPLPPPADEWTVPEVVRVANALAGEAEERAAGVAVLERPELSPERLERLGCAGLLHGWREFATELGAQLDSGERASPLA